MIRKKKLYARPRKAFEKTRIEEENVLVKNYGLKNKREIWKSLAKIGYFRKRAKALAMASREEQEVFFRKLNALGLKVDSITEALDLQVEDLLKRRLPTIVTRLKFANTIRQARQMVVHKRVRVGKGFVNSPSYLVRVEEENIIVVTPSRTPTTTIENTSEATEDNE